MIHSRCLVCDREIEEFIRFKIVEGGIIHCNYSDCNPLAEGSQKTAATATQRSMEDGERRTDGYD